LENWKADNVGVLVCMVAVTEGVYLGVKYKRRENGGDEKKL
jgi:hypothetical protein